MASDGDEEQEEETLCFCDTDRHLPTNDYSFEGAWVACDRCSRWCHGECAGLTKYEAEALEHYVCPPCIEAKAADARQSQAQKQLQQTQGALAKLQPQPLSDPGARQQQQCVAAIASTATGAASNECHGVDQSELGRLAGEQAGLLTETFSTSAGAHADAHAQHMHVAFFGPSDDCGGEDGGYGDGPADAFVMSCELGSGDGVETGGQGGGEGGGEEADEGVYTDYSGSGGSGSDADSVGESVGGIIRSEHESATASDGDGYDGYGIDGFGADGYGADGGGRCETHSPAASDDADDEDEGPYRRRTDDDDFFHLSRPGRIGADNDCSDADDDDPLGALGADNSADESGGADSEEAGELGAGFGADASEAEGSTDEDASFVGDIEGAERASIRFGDTGGEDGGQARCDAGGDVGLAVCQSEERGETEAAGAATDWECVAMDTVGSVMQEGELLEGWSPHPSEQALSGSNLADDDEPQERAVGHDEGVTSACNLNPAVLTAVGGVDSGAATTDAKAAHFASTSVSSVGVMADAADVADSNDEARAAGPGIQVPTGRRALVPTFPVGAEVCVLRTGNLEGSHGIVRSARSGYYYVHLAGGGAMYFRGKELVARDPSLAAQMLAMPAMQRQVKQQPTPGSRQPRPRREPDGSWPHQATLDTSSERIKDDEVRGSDVEEGRRPVSSWQSWLSVEGSRKRKPTQLYNPDDAEGKGRGDSGRTDAEGRNHTSELNEHVISVGCSILITKQGSYEHKAGVVMSMHNGYYQVRTECGRFLNMRLRELVRLKVGAQNQTSPMTPACASGSGEPLGPSAAEQVHPLPPPRPRLSGGTRRLGSRRPTDTNFGQAVSVVRGHHVGSMGRVIASRNGYLVVQLSTGRSAYFRGKDLQRIKGSQVEAVPKAWSRAVSTSVPDAALHGQTHPRSHTQLGSGRQGPSRSSHTARVSWRDNALGSDEEDEQDVVQQHEHAYARAIKMDPTALADVVARVERLLPLHTPEGTVHSAIEPEYTDESVRLHSPVEGEWPQLNLFQERWRRGEPVVLMDLQKRLGRKWGPHGFLQRFGAESVQMIDCRDGKSVHWLSLAHFFAGYLQPWTRALCPDTFRRMMLKLKDWPPDQGGPAPLALLHPVRAAHELTHEFAGTHVPCRIHVCHATARQISRRSCPSTLTI